MSQVTVSNARRKNRYEAHVEGKLAGFAQYRIDGDRITFTHTEVDSAFEGRGVGGALARGALDDVRSEGGRSVVPQCEFIAGWIDKHPDYADLLAS
jgi:predicted GNAT family acetyltransferase